MSWSKGRRSALATMAPCGCMGDHLFRFATHTPIAVKTKCQFIILAKSKEQHMHMRCLWELLGLRSTDHSFYLSAIYILHIHLFPIKCTYIAINNTKHVSRIYLQSSLLRWDIAILSGWRILPTLLGPIWDHSEVVCAAQWAIIWLLTKSNYSTWLLFSSYIPV